MRRATRHTLPRLSRDHCGEAFALARARFCSSQEVISQRLSSISPISVPTPFPVRDTSGDTALRVSRVGFGSPWVGAPFDRSVELTRALRDGRCNLVQLGSKISTSPKTDGEGKLLPLDADVPDESWESQAIREAKASRENLGLVLTLEAEGLSVEAALCPSRVMEKLDRMLFYHSLEYLDSLVLEIPAMKGGEVEVNTYRREMGLAVRRAMGEVLDQAQDKISTLGFSWQVNPHAPYPGRAPDSPLSDIMELRDIVMPSKPLVAMFPVGVGCGETLDGWKTAPEGGFGLPSDQGIFQIGTRVLHTQRADGRPFRFVDVEPRPIEELMPDLKSRFEMVIHLELQYKKRFESQDQPGGGFDSAEAGAGKTNKGEAPKGKEGPSEGKGDGENGLQGPLPHKADVCWAHILLQHQHQLKGLDEWEAIRDTQIKPTVNAAVRTLRAAGQAPGEWGYLYRTTLGSLLNTLTETIQVRKMHQLQEVSTLINKLCPSLPTMAQGVSSGRDEERRSSGSGETVMARFVSAALATGVDCVLTEEFAMSREAGRERGFEKVESDRISRLYAGFKLPP